MSAARLRSTRWSARKLSTAPGPDAEKHKNDYFASAFSDAISIYLLSMFLDVDYQDLRERDYPLLAPAALAERLRKIAELFPPNPDLSLRCIIGGEADLLCSVPTSFQPFAAHKRQ